jgi:putative zinc finger protein
MPGDTHNGMQCSEFEALLFDALDGSLPHVEQERFRAHARVCGKCGPMFAEVEAGQHWLKSLAEVEAPANLVNNILAGTSGIQSHRLQETAAAHQASLGERIREWLDSLFVPAWSTVRQPRFAMSFGMAFFSLSVALSVAGVKPGDIKQADLSRTGLRRTYYTTTARVVKYYENIRFVYEIESKVQEIKKVTRPAGSKEKKAGEGERKNNSSGQPEPRQERNYSRDENQPVLASAPENPPAVSVSTTRRYV